MQFIYKPKNNLEKFAEKIYFLLVENSEQSFYVGGMVRDLLLGNTVRDIDFATDLLPEQVTKVLGGAQIIYDSAYKKLGTIIVPYRKINVSITTFRKDYYDANRYPRVVFIKDVLADAKRRDLTINSLYLSHKTHEILDFHNGLQDIKNRVIKFIGMPATRVKEDPLRILRALRFALDFNFKMEKKTRNTIIANINLLNNITQSRARQEALRCRKKANAKILNNIILLKKILDRYAKKF